MFGCVLLKGAIEVWYHCFCISLSNISHFHMFCYWMWVGIDKCGNTVNVFICRWKENCKEKHMYNVPGDTTQWKV